MAILLTLIANVVLLFLFGLYTNIEKYVGFLGGASRYLQLSQDECYRNASSLPAGTYTYNQGTVGLPKENSFLEWKADDVNRGLLIYHNDGFFNLAALMYMIFFTICCILGVILPGQCYTSFKVLINRFTTKKHNKRSKSRYSVILANLDDRGLKVRIRKRSTVSERNKRSKWLVDRRRRKREIVRMRRIAGEEADCADMEDDGR